MIDIHSQASAHVRRCHQQFHHNKTYPKCRPKNLKNVANRQTLSQRQPSKLLPTVPRIMSSHGMLVIVLLNLLNRSLTIPRVEKYRPVFLDDVVGNTETIERLKIIAREGNMPHVIISGMPGIGKTTSVLCLARQLLGDTYKEAVLELNASDERGSCIPLF